MTPHPITKSHQAGASAAAKNVKSVVFTSSPRPISSAISTISSASAPYEVQIPWRRCEYFATSRSDPSTSGPRMKCCDSTTLIIAASNSSRSERYCAFKSSNGTLILTLIARNSRLRSIAPAPNSHYRKLQTEDAASPRCTRAPYTRQAGRSPEKPRQD